MEGQWQETKIIQKSNNPIWNEIFTFWNISSLEPLMVTVMDRVNNEGVDYFKGQLNLSLEGLDDTIDLWGNLEDEDGN